MPTGVWFYSYFAVWPLAVLECLALVMLVRQVQNLYGHWIRNDPDWGLPLGSAAPALPEVDVYGRPVSLAQGRKTTLFFLSPGCSACKEAIMRVSAIAAQDDGDVLLIVHAKELQTKLFVSQHYRDTQFPNVPVIADPQNRVAEHYHVTIVPYIVVVGAEQRIAAKGAGITLTEIAHLLRQADRSPLSDRRGSNSGRALVDTLETAL